MSANPDLVLQARSTDPDARQVAGLAETIFDQLAPDNAINGLTRHHRTLLSAAALLHDVGYHIAHESHHRGQILMLAHQLGYRVLHDTPGVWHWEKLWKRAGLSTRPR